jgi:hypothetical protein
MVMTESSISLSGIATVVRPKHENCNFDQDPQRSRVLASMKACYRADQQAKFLNLQAEADSLLQQLQAMKQQRQESVELPQEQESETPPNLATCNS